MASHTSEDSLLQEAGSPDKKPADKKTVIVDQYTRGLPPTRIPVAGGTVDFDQRFGTAAKCGPFRSQDPDYGNKR